MSPGGRWVVAIVGLLAANVLATVGLAATASSGGSEVIDGYYERGVHYDTAIDRATASRALGWWASVALAGGELTVAVRDAAGAAITDATVTVRGYQRAHATELLVLDLAPRGATYAAALHTRAGTHDLTITVDRGAAHFEQAVVVEVK